MEQKTNHAWRKTALVLLVINLGLLFWLKGGLLWLGVGASSVHEPERLETEIQAQAIHVLASGEQGPASQADAMAQAASQAASQASAEDAAPASAPVASAPAPTHSDKHHKNKE